MSHPKAKCSDLRYSKYDRKLEGGWSPQRVCLRDDKGLETYIYTLSLGQHLSSFLLSGGSSGKLVPTHVTSSPVLSIVRDCPRLSHS